jgi:enoyl-CoA hydratase
VPVGVDVADAVATVTVDRAEALNALDPATLEELRGELEQLVTDETVRAVVLTGAGDRAFVAGADIKAMQAMDAAQAERWGAAGQECGRLLEEMPKATVAAVNGFALGGGCELALACDVRYASSRARFGQPEINLAIVPGWGGTQRLARVVGVGIAKELILTGRVIDAEEALRIGLVSAVHEPADLLDRALETARALAAKSPLAVAAAKEATNLALQGSLADGLAHERRVFGALFGTADAKEGLAAFAEKREPTFTGR